MDTAIRVQILDEAIRILLRASAFGNVMKEFLSPCYKYIVEQIGYSSLGKATNPGEGKTLDSNQLYTA